MRHRAGSPHLRRAACALFLAVFLLVFQSAAPCPAIGQQTQEKAPEFELDDLSGTRHRVSDYRGKVLLLNFWATWCPECIEEMPSLNTLYERYRQEGLVVLGVSADRKKDPVLQALKKTGVGYPVMLDSKGGVFIKRYTVIGMPTTVIIDRNGVVAERIIGKTDFASKSFMKKIEGLLMQGGKK